MKSFITAHKEALKNILLVVLVFAMIGQTVYTWGYGLNMNVVPDNGFYADFIKFLGYNKDGSKSASATEAASPPIQAMVQGKNGLYGVQYNENGIGAVYDKARDLWKSAFDNANKLELSSEDDFKSALSKPFVFLKYDGAIPAEIIAGWFDSDFETGDGTDALTAEGILLSRLAENDYCLYIRNAKTSGIHVLKTKVSEDEFSSVTSSFLDNGCKLAMNLGKDYEKFLPETMIFSAPMAFDVLNSSNPAFVSRIDEQGTAGKDSIRRLLEAFFYNPYTSKKYDENNGDIQNFVENYRTLRVQKDGHIRFEASDVRGGIEAYQRGKISGKDADMQCIELGRTVTQNAISSMAGGGQNADGHVALTKWYYSEKTNTRVAVFTVRFGGIPIDSKESGFFARYEFRGNMMVRATLNMRQYTKAENEKQLYILPERQLAAVIGTPNTVGVSVKYQDTGDGVCSADWEIYSKTES